MSKKARVEEFIKYKQNSLNHLIHFPAKGSNQLAGTYLHSSLVYSAMEEYLQIETEDLIKECNTWKLSSQGLKVLNKLFKQKIDELTKELSEITKHKDYAEKVSYQTSTDNAKLIGKVTELKEEVERLGNTLNGSVLMNILDDNYVLNQQFHNEAREMIYSFATANYDEKLTLEDWLDKYYKNH